VSYDLYFLDPKPGQTWEEAMESMEDPPSGGGARQAAPPDWAHVVARARGVLGEVSTFENPPNWELTHEETGIQLGSFEEQWSITVPYWSEGDAAAEVMKKVYALAVMVEEITGLHAYDPQLGQPVAELPDPKPQAPVPVFDKVAKLFRDRGYSGS
jgi:hypothetical protein